MIATVNYHSRSGLWYNHADGNGTKYEYDALGRLTKRTWARGIDTTYAYDTFGSLTNETVVSNRDATNNWGSGILSAPFNVTNTIERFYDDFGRDAGFALNGVRQSTLAYDPSTGRLASMQIPTIEDEQNHCPPPPLFSTFQRKGFRIPG